MNRLRAAHGRDILTRARTFWRCRGYGHGLIHHSRTVRVYISNEQEIDCLASGANEETEEFFSCHDPVVA